jgi:hypothetical protein
VLVIRKINAMVLGFSYVMHRDMMLLKTSVRFAAELLQVDI